MTLPPSMVADGLMLDMRGTRRSWSYSSNSHIAKWLPALFTLPEIQYRPHLAVRSFHCNDVVPFGRLQNIPLQFRGAVAV